MQNFDGQVAVVTGAGSGIGAGTAKCLHENGASVALIARTKKGVEKVLDDLSSTRAQYYLGDVCDENQLISINKQIENKFGKIDILVTCAAAPAISKNIEKTSYRIMEAALLCSRLTGLIFFF